MKRKLAILVAGLVILAGTAYAGRPEPEEIARQCIASIREQTKDAGGRMVHVCRRTLDVIRERLEDGDEQGARQAARAGVERIGAIVHRASRGIRATAEQCVRVLQRVGAEEGLIRAVIQASNRATRGLRGAAEDCARAIGRALRDG